MVVPGHCESVPRYHTSRQLTVRYGCSAVSAVKSRTHERDQFFRYQSRYSNRLLNCLQGKASECAFFGLSLALSLCIGAEGQHFACPVAA